MFLLRFFIEETHDSEGCEGSNTEDDPKERTEIGCTEVKNKESIDDDGFFYEVIIEFHLIDFWIYFVFIIILFLGVIA